MKQLAAIESVHDELAGLGYQVIALSPDKPDIAGRTRRQEGLSFPVWSDQDVAVADALGLSLEVSDARYRALRDQYDIDLEAYSGRSHHKFPQSAIYLLDGTGTVRWRHASKDASKVVPARRILAAAREASGPESAP
jgi:peroxiredoxin